MSSDAYVTAARLRRPPVLSSSSSHAASRRALRRTHEEMLQPGSSLLGDDAGPSASPTSHVVIRGRRSSGAAASTTTRGTAFAAHAVARELGFLEGAQGVTTDGGEATGSATGNSAQWLDEERYEDWQAPTLDILRPDILVPMEDDFFPVAIAEDGETLPSELHPSYPFGDLHAPGASYVRPSIGVGTPISLTATEQVPLTFVGTHRARRRNLIPMPPPPPLSERVVLRARQTMSVNRSSWPFRRFGPGQGGPGALARAEASRPRRPYRPSWADLNLETLARMHPGMSHDPLEEKWRQQKGRDALQGATRAALMMTRTRSKQRSTEHAEKEGRAKKKAKTAKAPWRPEGPASLLDEIDALSPDEDSVSSAGE